MPGLEIKKFFYSSCELYLRSLISDQVSRLQTRGIRASIVNVSKEPKPEFASDEELDDTGYEEQRLRAGPLSNHFCVSGSCGIR